MYTSYVYNTGITAANLLNDVVALLTGETDKNNLSASCNKTLTDINVSARVAGWTIHDASAGTNAKCLKAPIRDNPSQFKYVVIDTNSAGYLMTKLYETWNDVTHTGTNIATDSNSTSYSQPWSAAYPGRIEISASIRHMFFYGISNGYWGCVGATCPNGIFERTRLSPWDTVENGYLPALYYAQGNSASECRILGINGDVTSSSASVTLSNPFSTGIPELRTCTANKFITEHVMAPFYCSNKTIGHYGGDISMLCDIYLVTNNAGTHKLDIIVYNGNEYIVWADATTNRFMVRKG